LKKIIKLTNESKIKSKNQKNEEEIKKIKKNQDYRSKDEIKNKLKFNKGLIRTKIIEQNIEG
jgi:hypothetical protein